MRIITGITEEYAPACAIALGTFDGVHLGHRAVIGEAVRLAAAEGLAPAVFTFSDLPKNAFLPEKKRIPPLCSPNEKASRFEELGVELMYSLPFGPELYTLSAEEFVRGVLIGRLNAKHVVCGQDHRFGAGGRGDASLLINVCGECGCSVTVVPPVSLRGERISSTRIRRLLELGYVSEARELLGHDV